MKNFLLYTMTVVCTLFFSNNIFADNVTVEHSPEGTVSIIGDLFVEGNLHSLPRVSIQVEDGMVTIEGRDNGSAMTTVNGQNVRISYIASDVTSLSVTGVFDVDIELYESVLADVAINAVYVSIDGPMWDVEVPSIIGQTSIRNGRGGALVNIYGVNFIGDVDISTGHGSELITFGRGRGLYEVGPVTIVGNLTMNTGHGTDYVDFVGSGTEVVGDVMVELGQDHDNLYGLYLTVDGNAYLSGGQGDDDLKEPVVAGELITIGFEY